MILKHKYKLSVFGLLFIAYVVIYVFKTPSNDRDWEEDQKILPYAEIQDDSIKIFNIRNFKYSSETSYEKAYYDKTFQLDDLEKVYFVVEPFSDFAGAAHTFLSFEFTNDTFVSISVEIRKEKGEAFSALTGLFNNYELMYVIADENDAVKLRSNFRKDKVYLFPVNAGKEKIKKLFMDMLKRTNSLKDNPEFYNTLYNTCTTNIMHHVNVISPKKIPFSYKVLFPGYSGELAYDLELIETTLPYEEAKSKYLINERAMKYADDINFSRKIRE